MKIEDYKILPTLIIMLVTLQVSFSQNDKKWNKYENTIEACKTMNTIDLFLEDYFSDQEYKITGINCFAEYNNIGVISGAYNKVINLDSLFINIWKILSKVKDIDYSKLRYIIIANYKNASFGAGDAIVISGDDFMKHINDFDKIKSKSEFLYDSYKSFIDPDIKKILRGFRSSSKYISNYGKFSLRGPNTDNLFHNNRYKTTRKSYQGCLKRAERNNK